MAASEWLRTFVAIYRTGSVTEGAAQRGLSQPAASQQLSALERSVFRPLFVRTPRGVEPTRRGREFYVQVADSLDRLEEVLSGIDGGSVAAPAPALRFGSSAEYFSYAVVPSLTNVTPALVARFGPDDELIDLLEHGELDVAVTSTVPGRRSLASVPIGTKRFVLVAAPGIASGAPSNSLPELGAWLTGKPWVTYSLELPMTRRFWQLSLGRPFSGDLRLVAPDLRAVAGAVARGVGASLLPAFACTDALARGAMVELHPVAEVAPGEPWFACTRVADAGRQPLAGFVAGLGVPGGR
jgi:DNA-binding transcriptional LysR family regulator